MSTDQNMSLLDFDKEAKARFVKWLEKKTPLSFTIQEITVSAMQCSAIFPAIHYGDLQRSTAPPWNLDSVTYSNDSTTQDRETYANRKTTTATVTVQTTKA